MPSPTIQQATALIDHIQTRFHDGHRRDLPALLALAADVEACGIDTGLVNALRTIGDHLELHMFKEEMRLFPMMEQGGNTLIERLIDDLHREHVEHEDELASHMRAEDDELFPLFAVQRSVAPAALKPSLPISTTNP
jgi:iron-sulfur cluster repair protein YtfE (RIC family)